MSNLIKSSSTTTTTSSTVTSPRIERFSLHLLEPGEIYFEDYLVYYHQTNSPTSNTTNSKIQIQKGKLKICSKSIVFDPIDINYPLVKFPFKSIERIYDFYDNDSTTSSLTSTSSQLQSPSATTSKLFFDDNEQQQIKKQYFYVKCKQIIKLKEMNKIQPYVIERNNTYQEYYFQFIFTNVNDTLQLIRQLHRANTLPYEQEELMLNSIVKSRLMRIKFNLTQLMDVYNENILVDYEVFKIQPLCTNPGKIYLTNLCLYYKPFNNLESETIIKIKLNKIKYLIKRRYKLKKNIACEILFDFNDDDDRVSDTFNRLPYLYLVFEDEIKCNDFYSKLQQQSSSLSTVLLSNYNEQENLLQKWRYGLISNYEYIMHLNTIADRSFNDLTQYPIYPWVLIDYKSATIDLNDESIYRDLSKPIGALNEQRLDRLKKRYYEVFSGGDEQNRFLYGSHYSTPAFVLYYLVREYPEWQLCLQNGKFDQPDRLFFSIYDTWRSCFNNDSDVKELIPEFYDLSNHGKFLINYQSLDLGCRQDGSKVDDVILPRWCNNDSEKFIQIMRDALESTYVSKNLHLWIDLIFGYKQRGIDAEKADNLFYYLCYEGAIDLSKIENQSERKSIEIQIQEFGQIPTQLFKTPHAARVKFDAFIYDKLRLTLDNDDKNNEIESLNADIVENNNENAVILTKNNVKSKLNAKFKEIKLKFSIKLHKNLINDLCFIQINETDRLPNVCTVSNDNWLKIYSINERSIYRSHNVNNFSLSSIDYIQLFNNQQQQQEHNLRRPQHTLLILSCWDNNIYIYDINYSRCLYTQFSAHDDAVTKVSVFNRESSSITESVYFILSSSWDGVIKIWRLVLNLTINNADNENNIETVHIDTIKMYFYADIVHDTSLITFKLSTKSIYLASLCDDYNLLIWKFQQTSSNQCVNTQFKLPTHYFTLQSIDYGDISDCEINDDSDFDATTRKVQSTIAFCTKQSFIKIINLQTKYEMFSLNLNNLLINEGICITLNKLIYNVDYIITVDMNGVVYFVDLNSLSDTKNSTSSSISSGSSTFLSNKIKLTSNSLQCLNLFNENIICTGDSDGNLYVLSHEDV